MKKIISLVVAVALIMSLAITAFAAQLEAESVESAGCNHDWGPVTESTGWEYYTDTQCKLTVKETKVCKKCAEVNQVTTNISYENHSEAIADASCNGTTQTHIYKCPRCHTYRYTRWVACIGAGKNHANGCLWLPI